MNTIKQQAKKMIATFLALVMVVPSILTNPAPVLAEENVQEEVTLSNAVYGDGEVVTYNSIPKVTASTGGKYTIDSIRGVTAGTEATANGHVTDNQLTVTFNASPDANHVITGFSVSTNQPDPGSVVVKDASNNTASGVFKDAADYHFTTRIVNNTVSADEEQIWDGYTYTISATTAEDPFVTPNGVSANDKVTVSVNGYTSFGTKRYLSTTSNTLEVDYKSGVTPNDYLITAKVFKDATGNGITLTTVTENSTGNIYSFNAERNHFYTIQASATTDRSTTLSAPTITATTYRDKLTATYSGTGVTDNKWSSGDLTITLSPAAHYSISGTPTIASTELGISATAMTKSGSTYTYTVSAGSRTGHEAQTVGFTITANAKAEEETVTWHYQEYDGSQYTNAGSSFAEYLTISPNNGKANYREPFKFSAELSTAGAKLYTVQRVAYGSSGTNPTTMTKSGGFYTVPESAVTGSVDIWIALQPITNRTVTINKKTNTDEGFGTQRSSGTLSGHDYKLYQIVSGSSPTLLTTNAKSNVRIQDGFRFMIETAPNAFSEGSVTAAWKQKNSTSAGTALTVTKVSPTNTYYASGVDRYLVEALTSSDLGGDDVDVTIDATRLYKVSIQTNSDSEAGLANLKVTTPDGAVLYQNGKKGTDVYRTKSEGVTFTIASLKSNYQIETVRDGDNDQFGKTEGYTVNGSVYTIAQNKITKDKVITITLKKEAGKNNVSMNNVNNVETTYSEGDLFIYENVSSNYSFKYRESDYQKVTDVTASWKTSGGSTVIKKLSVDADKDYISKTQSGSWWVVTITPKVSSDLTITISAQMDGTKVNNLTVSENKTVKETGSFLTKGLTIDQSQSRTAVYTTDYTKIGNIQDKLVLTMDCPTLSAQVTGAKLTYTAANSTTVVDVSNKVDFSKFDSNNKQLISLDLTGFQSCSFSLVLTTDRLGSVDNSVISMGADSYADEDFDWAVTGGATKTGSDEWTIPKYTPYFTFAVEPKKGLKATEKAKITVDGTEIVTVVSSNGQVISAKLGGTDLKVLPVYDKKTAGMTYTLVAGDEIGDGSVIRIIETTEKKLLTLSSNGYVSMDVIDNAPGEEEGWITGNTYQADINSELFVNAWTYDHHAVKTITVDNGKKTRTIKGFYSGYIPETVVGSIVMSEDKTVTMLTTPYAVIEGLSPSGESGNQYYDVDDLSAVEPGTYYLDGYYGENALEAKDLNTEKTTVTGGTASQITGLKVVIGEDDRGKTLKLNYAGADGVLGSNGKAFSGSLSIKVAKKLETITAIDLVDKTRVTKLNVGNGETRSLRIEPNSGARLPGDYPEVRFYKDADQKIDYTAKAADRIRLVRRYVYDEDYNDSLPVLYITGKEPSATPEENSFYMYIKSGSADLMIPITVKDATLKAPELTVTGVTDKTMTVKLSMPDGITYEDLTDGFRYGNLYYTLSVKDTASGNILYPQGQSEEKLYIYKTSDLNRTRTISLGNVEDSVRKVTVAATLHRDVDPLYDYVSETTVDGMSRESKTVSVKTALMDPAQPASMKLQNVKKYLYDNGDLPVAQIVYNGGDILATAENTLVTSDNPKVVKTWVYGGYVHAKYIATMTSSTGKATITVNPKGSAAPKSFSVTCAHTHADMTFADSLYNDITLYKKEGKALNYTLTPVFVPDDVAPYDKKPAVSYDPAEYSREEMKSYIDFNRKTGKISVKADYVPQSGDHIEIYAEALDKNGDTLFDMGITIYFTSEAPEEAGRLALITSTDKGATYTIITDGRTAVTKTVLLNNYTKLVMLNKDAPASGTVKAETLFENYVITDPHYELAVPSDVTLERGYLNGVSEQTDQFSERNVFRFGKTLKVTATEMRTQKKYTLSLKTEENVLPADAEVDHLEYIGPDGTVVKSDDDDILTFYDPGLQYPISVVFKDSDGNYYPSLIKDAVYGFSFKNAKDLKLTDQHQIGVYVVSMKNEAVDKKQKGTFKVSFKTAKTSGSGLQTKTSQEFTIINDPEDLDDPDFTDDGEKLYAKTFGQSKTLTASYTHAQVMATLPASYYDSKGKLNSAYKDAETLMNMINNGDGVTYNKGTLTFKDSINLTGSKPFTIYLTQGILDNNGNFVPKTRKGAWKVTPQAIGKFTPAKQYKMKTTSPEINLAKPGAAAVGGKNYDTNTVVDAGVYNVVTQGKENSFNSLFRVVNGTTLTITNDAKVIEKFIKAYNSNPKDAEKEWLTGYVQLTTNTYNPKNIYLTKVTVSFDGKLSNLTP